MSHKSSARAAYRYVNLRKAGVPARITSHQAWYLSGGVIGQRGDHQTEIITATVAKRVPDCEAFLPDYLQEVAR